MIKCKFLQEKCLIGSSGEIEIGLILYFFGSNSHGYNGNGFYRSKYHIVQIDEGYSGPTVSLFGEGLIIEYYLLQKRNKFTTLDHAETHLLVDS